MVNTSMVNIQWVMMTDDDYYWLLEKRDWLQGAIGNQNLQYVN